MARFDVSGWTVVSLCRQEDITPYALGDLMAVWDGPLVQSQLQPKFELVGSH